MNLLACLFVFAPATLQVGPGREFSRIESALLKAEPGSVIEVYPSETAYERTALMVRTPKLKIVGMGTKPIRLDGKGFDYSGEGPVPRAIIQFNPDSTGSTIQNFELTGAHNQSHNGAGVRIQSANKITIKDCFIHGNDMGIMSNGEKGNENAAKDQLVDHCRIYANGDLADPGYNHNLYLGGTSVTLRNCEVFGSLTGHNVKSRAHYTLLEYCFIHDSANRECDFVEAWDTERTNSNAVLAGCIVAKRVDCPGNRTVIHFGKEKGKRNGTLFLVNTTVITPFASAVVDLTDSAAKAAILNSVIFNPEHQKPTLVGMVEGIIPSSIQGKSNWMSSAYSLDGTTIDINTFWTDGELGITAPAYKILKPNPIWKAEPGYFFDGDGNLIPELAPGMILGGSGIRPGLEFKPL